MKLLFEYSRDPFKDDLALQYARMALAVSLENQVTLVFKSAASMLALKPFNVPCREVDYFDQERFLVEQEVDMYVLSDDIKNISGNLKQCVKATTTQDLAELYSNQDVVFRN